MKQVDRISIAKLKEMAQKMYGSIVKADVDIAKGIAIVDMGLHADGEAYLMERGSKQNDIWGINLHPDKYGGEKFIEFDSMINLRPSQGNLSKGVEDKVIREKIIKLINTVVYA